MYIKENNDLTGFRGLATEIVLQAIKDWRRLVKGAKETGDCNFNELEHFFRYECDIYLTGTSMTGEEILKKLKAEQLKRGTFDGHLPVERGYRRTFDGKEVKG